MHRILIFVGLILSFAFPLPATAQQPWPTKDVRLIVPFPPASPADIMVRAMSDRLKAVWGQALIVENIPGAAGSIGVGRLAKATADGYTLGVTGDAAMVVNISLYKQLSYDPIKDIAPIMQIGTTPNILIVNNDVPAKTVQELVALAKAKPGGVKFNSAGYGTSQHMGIEQLKSAAGIQVIHVPTKDLPVTEVMGGHVDANFANITNALPLVRAGKVRALGVSSSTRSPVAPDIPTIAEQGYPGFNAVAWFGFIAPAGTPDAIVRKVHEDVAKTLAEPELRKSLTDRGIQLADSTPESFAGLIRSEIPRIGELLKNSGIKLD